MDKHDAGNDDDDRGVSDDDYYLDEVYVDENDGADDTMQG